MLRFQLNYDILKMEKKTYYNKKQQQQKKKLKNELNFFSFILFSFSNN